MAQSVLSQDSSQSQASFRDRSIRLAFITSLISKLGTILLRLASIPIAIRELSMEMFGVYTTIVMAVNVIDMLHCGIGPALTKELSTAVAKGDRNRERTIFSTGILLSAGLTLFASIIAAALLIWVPIPDLFGEKFAPVAEVMQRAAWIGLAIIAIEMICITFELSRDGYLETRYTNAFGAGGNILGAIALFSGIWFFPTIEFMLIAVNGSIALAKLCNTAHMMWRRPYLFPRFALFRRALVKPLLFDSGRFSIAYVLAAMVEYNAMVFLIGHFAGPEAVGVYNVMITIHFSLAGIVGMFTKPSWPAIIDAHERNDRPWILKLARRIRWGGLGFSTLAAVGLVALGPILLPLWAGDEFYGKAPDTFQMSRWALAAFGLYFISHIWRHVNQILALGVGQIGPVSWVVVGEAILVLGLGLLILSASGNVTWVYAMMSLVILAVSSWLLPKLFQDGLGNGTPPEQNHSTHAGPPNPSEEIVTEISSPQ
ncbi:MAG: hypothetical protein AAF236_01600 [Verrucomicrobiota bacterium]